MNKKGLFFALSLMVSASTFAGGLLTNTNQSASFLRLFTQGAQIDVTGAYYNPAGLAFLPHEGFQISLNVQSAYQTRNIDASFSRYSGIGATGPTTEAYSKYYKGTASAPVIPSFQAAYKLNDDWVVSAAFAIGGGGGKASFNEGLPMFEAAAAAGVFKNSEYKVTPNMYDINSYMIGRQYIFNFQAGLSYKVNDWLAVYAGARMNYVSGNYEGTLDADLNKTYAAALGHTNDTNLMHLALDCGQSGWGINPILGVDAKFGKWNLAAKYEFQANLNVENDTKVNEMNDTKDYLGAYKHGVNTPNDIPALLMLAGSYEVLPSLRLSAEYHYFFDKSAGMAAVNKRNADGSVMTDANGTPETWGKQNELTHGTIEWLGGVEYDMSEHLTLSCSYQNTNYGLSDNYQGDTSFSCDSYSLGLGAKIKFSEHVSVNVAYMWTNYTDYTKTSDNYNSTGLKGTDIYSRSNKVFGASVDLKF